MRFMTYICTRVSSIHTVIEGARSRSKDALNHIVITRIYGIRTYRYSLGGKQLLTLGKN